MYLRKGEEMILCLVEFLSFIIIYLYKTPLLNRQKHKIQVSYCTFYPQVIYITCITTQMHSHACD